MYPGIDQLEAIRGIRGRSDRGKRLQNVYRTLQNIPYRIFTDK